jgi:hypothetical protein
MMDQSAEAGPPGPLSEAELLKLYEVALAAGVDGAVIVRAARRLEHVERDLVASRRSAETSARAAEILSELLGTDQIEAGRNARHEPGPGQSQPRTPRGASPRRSSSGPSSSA